MSRHISPMRRVGLFYPPMLLRVVVLLVLPPSCAPLGREEIILREPLGTCGDTDANDGKPPPCAITYYIAATGGSDNSSGLSTAEPWDTFTHAWQVMQPGSCLVIGDGTYTQALQPTISGTGSSPIVIRADNDGGATIDGLHDHIPCVFGKPTSVLLEHVYTEGLRCQNGQPNAVRVENASNITLRRITGHGADTDASVFLVTSAHNIVLEDVAGSGTGRSIFDAASSSRVVFRRCFGVYSNGIGENYVLGLRGTSRSIVENCVLTNGTAVANGAYGVLINRADWRVEPSQDTTIVGSVIYDVHRTGVMIASQKRLIETVSVLNSVIVNNDELGLFQRSSNDLRLDELTIVDNSSGVAVVTQAEPAGESKDPGFLLNLTGSNSFIEGGRCGLNVTEPQYLGLVDIDYFAFHDVDEPYCANVQAGPNDLQVQELPFDTQRFGKGAYTIRPELLEDAGEDGGIGADVRYRSQDGIASDCPLWPWPMEERIRTETGRSVTWEAYGGLWKSLDGVYP